MNSIIDVLIGGDFFPTNDNEKYFRKDGVKRLFNADVINLLNSADLKVFNLEGPLSKKGIKAKKCGPNLSADESCVSLYADLRPLFLGLGNNHIMDFGVEALDATLECLKKNNIYFSGAGNHLAEAKKPFIFTKRGKKIGIYSCAEHEFSIATEVSPGANPFNPLESFDDIQELRKKVDFLIILYHGGKEYYQYPSPLLQKCCRKMVDKGADIVVCQHSHCIGCREDYSNGIIIYGQGNFLFNIGDNKFVNSSLLLNVTFDKSVTVKEIPLLRSDIGIKLADNNAASIILAAYHKRSMDILKKNFVENAYAMFAKEHINDYLNSFLGDSLLVRIINKLLSHNFAKVILSQASYLKILNFIDCEAHRELFICGIKGMLQHDKEKNSTGFL